MYTSPWLGLKRTRLPQLRSLILYSVRKTIFVPRLCGPPIGGPPQLDPTKPQLDTTKSPSHPLSSFSHQ